MYKMSMGIYCLKINIWPPEIQPAIVNTLYKKHNISHCHCELTQDSLQGFATTGQMNVDHSAKTQHTLCETTQSGYLTNKISILDYMPISPPFQSYFFFFFFSPANVAVVTSYTNITKKIKNKKSDKFSYHLLPHVPLSHTSMHPLLLISKKIKTKTLVQGCCAALYHSYSLLQTIAEIGSKVEMWDGRIVDTLH